MFEKGKFVDAEFGDLTDRLPLNIYLAWYKLALPDNYELWRRSHRLMAWLDEEETELLQQPNEFDEILWKLKWRLKRVTISDAHRSELDGLIKLF